jgi:glutamate-1-semialdehyde aminotransferase
MIDHTCGLGSNLLSCNNNFGLPTTAEVVLAERLRALMPFVQKFKFLKTGSAACECAVRVARARFEAKYPKNTLGRATPMGIGTGYHGCHNWTIAAETLGSGCSGENYKKYQTTQELLDILAKAKKSQVAYVILEPVSLEISKKVATELYDLRKLCTEKDVCLIFDEVITGFRVPRYCIANYFEIAPDIICIGKALANGYSLAVTGMTDEYAETPGWFISNTHNGELASINSALATLDALSDVKLKELWKRGEWFQKEFNAISNRIQLTGYPTRAVWTGDKTYIAIFCEQAYKRGILLHPGAWWISFSHTDDILKMELNILKELIENIEGKNIQLSGLPTEPVFKRL